MPLQLLSVLLNSNEQNDVVRPCCAAGIPKKIRHAKCQQANLERQVVLSENKSSCVMSDTVSGMYCRCRMIVGVIYTWLMLTSVHRQKVRTKDCRISGNSINKWSDGAAENDCR